jgi:hypothetical protein
VTLRDSVRGLSEGFKADVDGVRSELRKREEKARKDAESLQERCQLLLRQAKEERRAREDVVVLRREEDAARAALEDEWRKEIADMRAEVESSSREGAEAMKLAT